jgi:hypothetical protein
MKIKPSICFLHNLGIFLLVISHSHPTLNFRAISKGLPETGGSSGVIKLRFVDADRPEDPLFTRSPVKWQNGEEAKVAIFRNEKKITGGDLSKLQIEILLVHDGFFTERGEEDFTEEEFRKHIHMYKGKESVLTTVNLRNGEAHLGSFFFTECSQRQKVRLAARVKRQDPANRVQEAITDPFVIKDRRSQCEYIRSSVRGINTFQLPRSGNFVTLHNLLITEASLFAIAAEHAPFKWLLGCFK